MLGGLAATGSCGCAPGSGTSERPCTWAARAARPGAGTPVQQGRAATNAPKHRSATAACPQLPAALRAPGEIQGPAAGAPRASSWGCGGDAELRGSSPAPSRLVSTLGLLRLYSRPERMNATLAPLDVMTPSAGLKLFLFHLAFRVSLRGPPKPDPGLQSSASQGRLCPGADRGVR